MAPEKLDFAATHYKQTAGTDGIADWMEIPGIGRGLAEKVTKEIQGDKL